MLKGKSRNPHILFETARGNRIEIMIGNHSYSLEVIRNGRRQNSSSLLQWEDSEAFHSKSEIHVDMTNDLKVMRTQRWNNWKFKIYRDAQLIEMFAI